MTIPPRRPWVLEWGICRRIRRTLRDALLVCPTCDQIPTRTETTR